LPGGVAVNEDDARAQLFALLPFASSAEMDGFMAATLEEQTAMIAGYKASAVPTRDPWDEALKVMAACQAFVKFVPVVGQAVDAVFTVIEAL
jgi:hypothetical protein